MRLSLRRRRRPSADPVAASYSWLSSFVIRCPCRSCSLDLNKVKYLCLRLDGTPTASTMRMKDALATILILLLLDACKNPKTQTIPAPRTAARDPPFPPANNHAHPTTITTPFLLY